MTWIYETKYGIKNINISNYICFPHSSIGEPFSLNATELYLDADFMKDDYSLLDCSINETPHFKLMQALLSDEDISHSEYIQRALKGYLDWRDYQSKSPNYDDFKAKFKQLKSEIETNSYSPIEVFLLDGRYYIHDGKHRAALCAALGKNIKCVLIDVSVYTTGVWAYLLSLVVSQDKYSKHKFYFEKLQK